MPVYYNGDNIAPFSQGMMIGFELFDRARSRRVEAEDRKVALAQNEERMKMAREDQEMQRADREIRLEDRDVAYERQRVADLDKKRLEAGAKLGDLAKIHGGFDKIPRELAVKIAREGDPTRYASADDDAVYGGAYELAVEGSNAIEDEIDRQRQRAEGREDYLWQQNTAASIRRAEQERLLAQQQSGLRGIIDLMQPEAGPQGGVPPPIIKDTTPTAGGQRGGASQGAAGSMSTTPAAPVTPDGAPTAPAGFDPQVDAVRGFRRSMLEPYLQEFDRNPLKATDSWLRNRDTVTDATMRAQLDLKAAEALKARSEMLTTEIGSAVRQGLNKEAAARAPEAIRLGDQARDLGERIAADRIAAVAQRPVGRGEPAALAVREAVTAQMGTTPKARQDEIRALHTQMARFSANPPRRFNEEQLNRITRAAAVGVISPEAAINFARTGSLEKPSKPEVKVVGDMLAIITDTGIRFVSPGDQAGGGGKSAGTGTSEERLANKERLEFVGGQLEGMVENGDFDKSGPGDPNFTQVYGGFFEAITRFGPQIEAATGVSLTAPGGGRTSLARVDEGTAHILLQAYRKYRAEETDAVFKDGKGYDWYVAQELGVPSQAAQEVAGDDWPVELLPE